jgi:hypothetical protein
MWRIFHIRAMESIAGKARQGRVRQSKARQGKAGQSMAWYGTVCDCMAE